MTTKQQTLREEIEYLLDDISDLTNLSDQYTDDILDLFQKTMEQVIGEDEVVNYKNTEDHGTHATIEVSPEFYKNELRKHQLTALQSIISGEKI